MTWSARASVVLLLGCWTGVAGAGESTDVSLAAAVQVRLLVDMGDLGAAVGLARRGERDLPDDPTWAVARLDALDAAGMDPWIGATLGELSRRTPDVQLALATWGVAHGWADALPPAYAGPSADLARAELALVRGDTAPARALGTGDASLPYLTLRAHLLTVEAAWLDLGALVDGWPAGDDVDLRPLAPLLTAPVARADRAALAVHQEALLARIDRLIAAGTPVAWMRAAEVLLVAGDAARLARLADRVDAARGGPPVIADVVLGIAAGPTGWTTWQVPRRARWTREEADAAGRALGKGETTTFPWARPDEARRVALAGAAELIARGRALDAEKLMAEHAGACFRPVGAEWAVSHDRRTEGRSVALRRLFACVGGVDLSPSADPAGMSVDRSLDEVSGAWRDLGRVLTLGGWDADAAVAFAVVAHLAPDPESVSLARASAADAKLPVDRRGVPTVEGLVAALPGVSWLHPQETGLINDAERTLLRTIAWLAPTPDHLAARVTDPRICVPTIRDRCQLELAVAHEAFRRAGRPPPSALPPVVEPAAKRAAGPWLDRLARAGFARRVSLDRALTDGTTPSLADVLALGTGVRVGRPIPEFSASGVRAVDLRGRVVLLVFWASWTRQAYSLLPLLDGLASRWDRDGLDTRVIAVSADDEVGRYAQALAKLPGWQSMSVTRDPGLRAELQVDTLPSLYLIDAAGVLREVRVGYDGGSLDTLDQAVRSWAALASP